MFVESMKINLQSEAKALVNDLSSGDPRASIHLARLIEADTKGAFRPFAEVIAARLSDHLKRYAELGITEPEITLEDEVYHLLQTAAMDWDGYPCDGSGPGEKA
ncbi:MAG: hypothetical protein HYR94_04190 [Chloroflexi bacterium]|nr:hypothetical protein [Chloroflexota bacterium]